ncbi:LPS export ABC transporter periplasmic protein LptC [bacterium]|nr:LPS export ABC transporter periplasmic protein LptC [candidate division CSSED10-310 bacterium]
MRKLFITVTAVLFILTILGVSALLIGRSILDKRISSVAEDEAIKQMADFLETSLDMADLSIKPFDRIIHSGGNLEWEIHAQEARTFQEEGQVVLQKISQVRFYDDSGAVYTIKADKGVWNQDDGVIRVEGDITAEYRDGPEGEDGVLVLNAETLNYDRKSQRLTTDRGIRLQWRRITLTGRKLMANLPNRHIQLDADVQTVIEEFPGETGRGGQLASPLVIRSPALVYEHDKQMLRYVRGVTGEYGPYVLHSNELSVMYGKELHYIHAEGAVRLEVNGAAMEAASAAGVAAVPGGVRDVRVAADNLVFDYQTNVMLLSPNVVLTRTEEELRCAKLELYFAGEGNELTGAIASGDVRGRSLDTGITCERALLDSESGSILLSGAPRLSRPDGEVTAPLIRIYPERRYYKLTDGVSGAFLPKGDATAGGGYFHLSGGAPVKMECREVEIDELTGRSELRGGVVLKQADQRIYSDKVVIVGDEVDMFREVVFPGSLRITRGEMVLVGDRGDYYVRENRLLVEDACKLWQGDDYIRSDRMSFLGNEDVMLASGKVETFLAGGAPQPANDGEDAAADELPLGIARSRDVTVWADQLRFERQADLATFTGNVRAQQEEVSFNSERLVIYLDAEAGGAKRLVASGKVRLSSGEISAQCDELRYLAGENMLLLVGEPPDYCKVFKKDRGTQGKRIKILLDEKRYVVEGGESVLVPNKDNREGMADGI